MKSDLKDENVRATQTWNTTEYMGTGYHMKKVPVTKNIILYRPNI